MPAKYARARGMRDILPEDEIVYKGLISAIEDVYRAYGYDPVSQPAIERLEVLEAKGGDGIATEIFRMDDGELGLRFDLTVSLARLYAENAGFALPFKRYCIEKVWRREEPQYGRYREFLQADADILGAQGAECEAELIACARDALDRIGVGGYKILINSRKLMSGVLKHFGVPAGKMDSAIRIIDKLDKKSESEVARELEQNGIGNGTEIIAAFKKGLEYYEGLPECAEGVADLKRLFSLLGEYGVTNWKFEPSIARGLGYYTGIVYEIKSDDPQLGTIAAGGRYDTLIGIYAGKDVPAVGISFGVDRIATLLKRRAKYKTLTDIVLVNVAPENYGACIRTAQQLRKKGIAVRIDLMGRNMRKQLDYAASLGVRFAGIIGGTEASTGKIMLKDLSSGEQASLDVEEVAKKIIGARG
ncbi:MAG: histidine--tRNA ligase [Candidatus Micrarchaeota archaeon]|nr:histidine--tRNA ligase [Candidatus Micrarchaeota archaeon]